jgi:hypothetical protein
MTFTARELEALRDMCCYNQYPELRRIHMPIARFHIINGTTHKIEVSANTEAEAIKTAERLAVQSPGTDFVVMQSLTKSCCKSVITDRF